MYYLIKLVTTLCDHYYYQSYFPQKEIETLRDKKNFPKVTQWESGEPRA